MEKIKLFFTALLVFVAASVASAQSGVVKGVVKEAGTGEAIPFASIRIQGTLQGTNTDANGNYSLQVADLKSAVLEFSSVGFKNSVVPVAGQTVINVSLEQDSSFIEDAVVVAYGVQKREAITGSVSSVKGEGLAEAPVSSVDKMLSGKLAGVTISATSGQPGAASQIRIRGNGSINASNAPLWVVDGIPVISGDVSFMSNTSNLLANINPSDIESITVLKDAAAAAAYGSRAANGVILVTTKSGKSGEAQFTASAKYGINWLRSDTGFRQMNARELLGYQRAAVTNAGMDPDDPTSAYYLPLSLLDGPLYNVVNEFSRLGNLQEYEIGARGGNSRAKYYSSFSYHKNEGVFYGVNFQKLQGRLNASYKLRDNLETGVLLNLAYTKQSDVPMQSLYYANPLWTGETLLPWERITDDEGNFVGNSAVNSGDNPRGSAEYDDKWDSYYRINATAFLRWNPFDHVTLETKNSLENIFQYSRAYYSPQAHANSSANQLDTYNRWISQLTTSNTATYSNIFGGVHNLNVVVGQEAMRYGSFLTEEYVPTVSPEIPYFVGIDNTQSQLEYSETKETMLSFFGIADYNYDHRYFLQASVREDGSSLFGADNKWGLFWALSGSWNISNEAFFKSVRPVSLLKLRLSYGVNGNNGISAYQAYGLYSPTVYNGLSGYLPSQLENRVLSWERNKTWNVGIDFGFLRNRINGSIDVYNRKTVDLLLDKKIPETTGFSSIFTNVGSMRNRGVELQLEAELIRKTDMLWTVGGNVAFNRTKILDLGGEEFLGTNTRQVVGRSMYSYYLFDYAGVNPSNGEALWYTDDGDGGRGPITNQYSQARRYYAGSPEPKAVGGFNTSFTWKGFNVGAFFEFKAGGKVLLVNEHHYMQNDGSDFSMNQMAASLDYWKNPGDTGVNPKPIAGNTSNSAAWWSTRWLEDASYLRFKDLTVSYTLPKTLVSKVSLNNVRFYVSGLNLYCFNDVYFWDPEQGVTGLTVGGYPTTKSIVGGIELTF